MEKICIVRRRKPGYEGAFSFAAAMVNRERSPLLSIPLTPQQSEVLRSNGHFQRFYSRRSAPVVLNIHFNDGLPQKLLKSSEICEMLQISRKMLGRLLRDGEVKGYRIGRLRRFVAEDIMEYLAHSFGLGRLRTITVDISQRPGEDLETLSE